MGLFGKKRPRTKQELAAINAKLKRKGLDSRINAVKFNKEELIRQQDNNLKGRLSPAEQGLIVGSHRSSELAKGDRDRFALPSEGDRTEQAAAVLNKQILVLDKRQTELEFEKEKQLTIERAGK
jgi:hypothetical protein